MSADTKIIIDASSRILYASFYIEGLYQTFGRKNVSFSTVYFKDLNRHSDQFAFEHYFAFVMIEPDGAIEKIAVDFCDSTDINPNAYNWCDTYAKINYIKSDADTKKLLLIPPSFGIRIWNLWESAAFGVSNLIKCKFKPIVTYKRFFHDYYLQYRRPKHSAYQTNDYQNTESVKPFLFMIGTLWDENGEQTNQQRKNYIEQLKARRVEFEGGFYIGQNHPKADAYKMYRFEKAYSTTEYLQKTKRSAFVFNTPAVHGCLGWKLAEFLAMGKAIVSTPICNAISPMLENGVHIHMAMNNNELADAINLLLNDSEHRFLLGRNAAAYYNSHMAPSIVIQSIMRKITQQKTSI